MTRIRFVHTADLHLDSPFTGLKSVAPPDVAAHLREATFRAYDAIIDLCLREKVDALLVAGDIYDGADRSLRAQLKFIDGLKRLDEAGIRAFVCHGNHDPLDGWEAQLARPAGCHRFGPQVEAVSLDPSEPAKGSVYGYSYPKRNMRENLIPLFPHPTPGEFSIGLLHCNVGANTGHEPYAPCTLSDLEATGIDYWALGHVHTRQVLRERGPTIVYPGNPQGLHPNETGARGVYLVEVSDSGQVALDFRAVDSVRWERLEMSIDGLETEQALLDLAELRAGQLIDAADGRHVLYRVEIAGRSALHHSLRRPGFADDLQALINESWSRQQPFAWCERVRVATRPEFDREQRLQAGDFVGDLLRLIDEAQGDSQMMAQMAADLQPLYNHSRAKRYLQDLLPAENELLDLLTDAEARCIERLVDEEMA